LALTPPAQLNPAMTALKRMRLVAWHAVRGRKFLRRAILIRCDLAK
jgi:hypothetical protein